MKTKKEILKAIGYLREQRDGYAYMKSKSYTDISNGQIRALKWVLEYKVGNWFWCVECRIQHKNLKCPKCGNETRVISIM